MSTAGMTHAVNCASIVYRPISEIRWPEECNCHVKVIRELMEELEMAKSALVRFNNYIAIAKATKSPSGHARLIEDLSHEQEYFEKKGTAK